MKTRGQDQRRSSTRIGSTVANALTDADRLALTVKTHVRRGSGNVQDAWRVPSLNLSCGGCMSRRRTPVWTPSDDQMRHWPSVSGNTINGVGEDAPRRPSPVYWRSPETIPHGPLQRWFYQRTSDDETLAEARRERQRAIDEPLAPIAPNKADLDAEALTQSTKRAAADCGADDVGVTPMRAEYVFEGDDGPNYPSMIVIAVEQAYDAMSQAPSMHAPVSPIGCAGKATTLFPTADQWRARSCSSRRQSRPASASSASTGQ
jgi:hypothetical protein